MVEASWYLPSKAECTGGNKSGQSKVPLTVLNLRGQAEQFELQTEALVTFSNLVVLVINCLDLQQKSTVSLLKKVQEKGKKIIVISNVSDFQIVVEFLSHLQKYLKVSEENFALLSLFDTSNGEENNADDLKTQLAYHIWLLLKGEKGISLEEMSKRLPKGIFCDENDICVQGKKMAESLFAEIKTIEDPILRKSRILPLQGETLWQEWCKQQKDEKRDVNKTSLCEHDQKKKSMKMIRLKQIDACNSAPSVMALFVHNLINNIDNYEICGYFLFWLQNFLDGESLNIRANLLPSKANGNSKEIQPQRQQNAAEVENSLLGLEHLFREIGQIYEAFMCSEEDTWYKISDQSKKILNTLPNVIAQLLLLGQPIELMDGDTSNVPLKWLHAVFKALDEILLHKRVLTVSVLGIQSSGKSTLLNTMFGLRFPVSAGRCTRGVFVQLISVEESADPFGYEYLAVIDTEGIGAPDLEGDNIFHDNELATFVIGVPDIVLINIKGETTPEIENVLQIVIYALIKFKQSNKQLNLKQSCIFVHQNVSAFNAEEKTLSGSHNMCKKLNNIVKEVASLERIDGYIQLSDVINFIPDEDRIFVPDLWHGTPPMTHISSKYSETAVEVRRKVLLKGHNALSLENWYLHINSLWKGILAEDFVFSFHNVLQVKAYNMLEAEYQRLTNDLNRVKLKWTSDIPSELCKCQNMDDLHNHAGNLINKLNHELDEKHEEIRKKLITFIETSQLKSHMIQWKEKECRNLQYKTTELKNDACQKIKQDKEKYKQFARMDSLKSKKEKELYEKAKELAKPFQGSKPPLPEIKAMFETEWEKWLNELAPKTSTLQENEAACVIEEDIKNSLQYKFTSLKSSIFKDLTKSPLSNCPKTNALVDSLGIEQLPKNHATLVPFQDKLKGAKPVQETTKHFFRHLNVFSDYRKDVINALNTLFFKIDVFLQLQMKKDANYDKSQIDEVLETIRYGFETFNKEKKNNIQLSDRLLCFVALHVSRYCFNHFKNVNRSYEKRHGVRTALLSEKSVVLQMFIDTCYTKSDEIIATNVFCADLQKLIQKRVFEKIYLKITDNVQQEFQYKRHLMIRVMTELAEHACFDSFVNYIRDPASYILTWITQFTNRTLFDKDKPGESKYMKWAKDETRSLINNIKESAKHVTENEKPYTFVEWVKRFKKQVIHLHLMITPCSFQNITEYKIVNFDDFLKGFEHKLDTNTQEELCTMFAEHTPDKIKWVGDTPYKGIFDSLWGCKDKCPLCHEPCQNTIDNHASSHICIQHRPIGVSGTNWLESKMLVIESCSFMVQTKNTIRCGTWCNCKEKVFTTWHPFKQYKQYMTDWEIAPCTDMCDSMYWNWFVANYEDQLAKHYDVIRPEIPSSWKEISKKDAIKSLCEVYSNY